MYEYYSPANCVLISHFPLNPPHLFTLSRSLTLAHNTRRKQPRYCVNTFSQHYEHQHPSCPLDGSSTTFLSPSPLLFECQQLSIIVKTATLPSPRQGWEQLLGGKPSYHKLYLPCSGILPIILQSKPFQTTDPT